jgi:indole-3-glycerol phosphate synthase
VSVLDELIVGVREDLAARQAQVSLDELKEQAAARPPALDGAGALRQPGIAVIAEVKRSSPSKGALAAIADPAALAATTRPAARASSACSPSSAASAGAWPTSTPSGRRVDVPVLRKDFVVTSYQVWEARAHGADLACSSSPPSSRRRWSPWSSAPSRSA